MAYRLINSPKLEWGDGFLTALLNWCSSHLVLDLAVLYETKFTEASEGVAFSGRAWWGPTKTNHRYRIRVAIGSASLFPVQQRIYPGRKHERFTQPRLADRTEALVSTTAHELTHIREYVKYFAGLAKHRGGEAISTSEECRLLYAFRENRSYLLAQWKSFDRVFINS